MSIPARYSGFCPECGERWQPGDLIRAEEYPLGELPVWQHAVCPVVPTLRAHSSKGPLMSDLTPETLAELRRLAELARDLPGGSNWLHGEVADGTETVSEWIDKCSADPGAPAAGRLRLVWSEGSGETKVIVQAIVGDTETAPIRAAFMANANPAVVLALLDAAAERDALANAVKYVRALHYAADNDGARTPICETCRGEAGVHECGCWAERDREPVCGHCNEGHKGMSVPWPCPTIRALDGGES